MPRARGPKVPVSAAALSDALGVACEIVSSWRDDLAVSVAACGTAPVEARNARCARGRTESAHHTRVDRPRFKSLAPFPASSPRLAAHRSSPIAHPPQLRRPRRRRLQSYETRAAGTQTTDPASARASDARASEDENLARFVRAVTPSMEEALRENAASETFAEDFYESALGGDDDDPFDAAGAECVHTLRPRPTPTDGAEDADDADAKFWRRLKPTGVSWNCNGYSLAVSYGRFDVTGWCDTPGAVCVWNLRRADVRADRPDFTIEHDVAIQVRAFCTLVPIRPCSRGERRSLRNLPGASHRSSLAFNTRARRLSTPTDAFQLHPDPVRRVSPDASRDARVRVLRRRRLRARPQRRGRPEMHRAQRRKLGRDAQGAGNGRGVAV